MKVYFVGFGPGDKELLTIKAYRLLRNADLIIYPGSLIDEEVLEEFKAEKVNSYGMRLEEIVDTIEKAVRNGKLVVRLCSGDPSIFSAVWEQIRELRKRGMECEIVPGVSSVSASAAALGVELTTPSLAGIAIVRTRGKTLADDCLEELAKLPLTIVVMLGVDKIDYIVEKVGRIRSFDEPCAVVYHASRKDEKKFVSKLGEIADIVKAEGIKRTATVIIGKAILGYDERSHLYGV